MARQLPGIPSDARARTQGSIMNKQRIINLAEVIWETDYKLDIFDMNTWLNMDKPLLFQPVKDTNDPDEITDLADACNTRACIAGHAVILFDDTGVWQESLRVPDEENPKPGIAELAARLLDITPAQADVLFTPNEGSDPKREIPHGYRITAGDSADTLRRLAETGEVQWLIERCLCCGDAAKTGDCRCTVGECNCCGAEPGDGTNCGAGPDCDCREQNTE